METDTSKEKSNITITFRIPQPFSPHFTLDVDICTSIEDLKTLLQLKHPLHPESTDQKLIFQGQMLKDDQIISEIVSGTESVVFHLVLTNEKYQSKPQPISEVQEEQKNVENVIEDKPFSSSTDIIEKEEIVDLHREPFLAFIPHTGQTMLVDPAHCIFVNGMAYLNIEASKVQIEATAEPIAESAPPTPEPQRRNFSMLWFIAKLVMFVAIFSQNGGFVRLGLLLVISLAIVVSRFISVRIPPASIENDGTADENNGILYRAFKEMRNLLLPFISSLIPAAN